MPTYAKCLRVLIVPVKTAERCSHGLNSWVLTMAPNSHQTLHTAHPKYWTPEWLTPYWWPQAGSTYAPLVGFQLVRRVGAKGAYPMLTCCDAMLTTPPAGGFRTCSQLHEARRSHAFIGILADRGCLVLDFMLRCNHSGPLLAPSASVWACGIGRGHGK